jgi:hypothetical protein
MVKIAAMKTESGQSQKIAEALTWLHCTLQQRFSNFGTSTPWGTTDAFQGYHKSSFINILTALIKK